MLERIFPLKLIVKWLCGNKKGISCGLRLCDPPGNLRQSPTSKADFWNFSASRVWRRLSKLPETNYYVSVAGMSRSMSKSLQLVTVAPKKDYKIAHLTLALTAGPSCSKGFSFYQLSLLLLKHPVTKLQIKRIQLNLLFTITELYLVRWLANFCYQQENLCNTRSFAQRKPNFGVFA